VIPCFLTTLLPLAPSTFAIKKHPQRTKRKIERIMIVAPTPKSRASTKLERILIPCATVAVYPILGKDVSVFPDTLSFSTALKSHNIRDSCTTHRILVLPVTADHIPQVLVLGSCGIFFFLFFGGLFSPKLRIITTDEVKLLTLIQNQKVCKTQN
jgi:hypothetical protein